MQSIGIFYATISGNTKHVANAIADALSIAHTHVYNVADIDVATMLNYDHIILGTPTYGKGDLHYIWSEILEEMKPFDFTKKRCSIFCLGDQKFHGSTFAGALVKMYDLLTAQGITVTGKWTDQRYTFEHSPSLLSDNSYHGLVLDEVNQHSLSVSRIETWCKDLVSDNK